MTTDPFCVKLNTMEINLSLKSEELWDCWDVDKTLTLNPTFMVSLLRTL